MIPRIAHFHWEGPMPWMRMMGIYTFMRQNPDWEVRLHRTPKHIRQLELPCHGNEADWVWLDAVHRYGGFAVATDTVFVRPMPEEWLDSDFCGCSSDDKLLYHCCFGAVPGHEFVGRCLEECNGIHPDDMLYQTLGIELLNRVLSEDHGSLSGLPGKFFPMPPKALTSYKHFQMKRVWGDGPDLEIDEGAVGVTWFGGDAMSKKCEPISSHDSPIVRLALAVSQMPLSPSVSAGLVDECPEPHIAT